MKRVHSTQDDEEMADLRTFKSGIEALADVGHHHIVKLCGLCSWVDQSCLVYEFMERGSLGNILCKEEEQRNCIGI